MCGLFCCFFKESKCANYIELEWTFYFILVLFDLNLQRFLTNDITDDIKQNILPHVFINLAT
uniref:Uncharacterized protein n=1 Tax=Anguilla anguilla TaxID=7936 RepID=A0A0E9X1D0_ANGAN